MVEVKHTIHVIFSLVYTSMSLHLMVYYSTYFVSTVGAIHDGG